MSIGDYYIGTAPGVVTERHSIKLYTITSFLLSPLCSLLTLSYDSDSSHIIIYGLTHT